MKSAALGYAAAQCELGTFYQKGLGVPQSFQRSFHYFQQSAEQNDAEAHHNIARHYLRGWGCTQR